MLPLLLVLLLAVGFAAVCVYGARRPRDDVAVEYDRLTESFREVERAMGEALLPAMRACAKAIGDLGRAMAKDA